MTGTSERCSATIERKHRVLQAREKGTASIGSSSYYKQHKPIKLATGTKAQGYDTHPFAGISHIDRTRNIFHNCHNLYLQGKAVSKNVEMTSILWKTVEKKGYEKINATQMTSISTQRIQQFQQKDKLFIYRYLSIILFVE